MPSLEPIFLSLLPSTSSIHPSPLPTSRYSSTHFVRLWPPAFHKNHQRNLSTLDVPSLKHSLLLLYDTPLLGLLPPLLTPSQTPLLFSVSPLKFLFWKVPSVRILLSLLHSPWGDSLTPPSSCPPTLESQTWGLLPWMSFSKSILCKIVSILAFVFKPAHEHS